MNYYAEMEQRIDQLTGTLRAVTAERDALREGIKQLAEEYDGEYELALSAACRDLIFLLALADRVREQAAAGQAEEGEGGGKAT